MRAVAAKRATGRRGDHWKMMVLPEGSAGEAFDESLVYRSFEQRGRGVGVKIEPIVWGISSHVEVFKLERIWSADKQVVSVYESTGVIFLRTIV